MIGEWLRKLKGAFFVPDEAPVVRCYCSEPQGPRPHAFLMVILCDEPMSTVYGKLTCRFDRSNSTLTVSEAYVLERWRHVSMFQDMLHAAVERCRAKRVIVEETSNEAQWSRLFGQVVAGARVQASGTPRAALQLVPR